MSSPAEPIALARSLLFVPGHRPERFDKALASAADAVIVDLEDAVPLTAKDMARQALEQAWSQWSGTQRARLVVRINPAGTPWHDADLGLLPRLQGLGAVMLPKAESADQITRLSQRAAQLPVVPLLESAEGFAHLHAIAKAPGVLRLGLGHIDLQADLGMACDADEAELAPARWALVLATRRAGLAPAIDGVTTSATDLEAVLQDARRSRRFGFGGKLCIHPAQVEATHSGLAPTAAETAWAKRVLQAQASADGGAFAIDGKMVDAPVLSLARRWLRLA